MLELVNLLSFNPNRVAAIKNFEEYFFEKRPRLAPEFIQVIALLSFRYRARTRRVATRISPHCYRCCFEGKKTTTRKDCCKHAGLFSATAGLPAGLDICTFFRTSVQHWFCLHHFVGRPWVCFAAYLMLRKTKMLKFFWYSTLSPYIKLLHTMK